MAEPGDEMAVGAGDRSQLRASHAEREQAIDVLKNAFVQGRLATDELDLRVGSALASRTRAELTALTADIPVDLTGARPPKPTRESGNTRAGAAVLGSIAVWWSTQIAVSLWVGDNGRPAGLLILVIAAALLQASILSAWLIGRASRPSAPGPSSSGGLKAAQHPGAGVWTGQHPQMNRCCRMIPPRRCW
jgi:hypothetical protein